MNDQSGNLENYIIPDVAYNCPVCGARRYVTDHGNHELTLHCSSTAARFWDFPRGSAGQTEAMQHWNRSRQELFLSVDDTIRFAANYELAPQVVPVSGYNKNAVGG
jgi:hypothetical protein